VFTQFLRSPLTLERYRNSPLAQKRVAFSHTNPTPRFGRTHGQFRHSSGVGLPLPGPNTKGAVNG